MIKLLNNKDIKNTELTKIVSLLIHAAKIDEHYTEQEKKLILNAIIQLNSVNFDEAEKLLKIAEKKRRRVKSNSRIY